MESIKNRVAVVGMGCTQFGELWDRDADSLVLEATDEALQDAGIELKDIQAAWVGTMLGMTGMVLSSALQSQYIPVTRIENACATGQDALRNACYAVAAKVFDIVLVVGVEKLKDEGYGGLPLGMSADGFHPVYGAHGTAPGRYALAATRYFHRYGLTREEGKTLLAMISVKSHHNGARNPKAHMRREVTLEQVMKAPIIAWPLGLFDCCGVTDGASAAVLCRPEDARRFRDDYMVFKGFGLSAGPGMGKSKTDYDYTHWEETWRAATQAYAEAGIKEPRKEINMVECHDCFSIAELVAVESMEICERGHAKEDVDSGAWTQEGEIPVNLSGGLKSFGHPIGASGCREVYEIYKQIQGKAEEPSRQLKDVRLGLAHNQGGHPGRFICGVAILGASQE
ncbi:MAG: acetyl-CoA acetyltransferase [Chloroflexota bacterium]|nr:acetyl-CoA acetyltransferase [Chloroflexota bacterium]